MKRSALEFQINQLRQQNMVLALESLLMFVAALFSTALLPQILFKYVYANVQLTEEPVLLGRIPDVAFAIGSIFFIFAMIKTVMNVMKIGRLENDASNMTMSDVCCMSCNDNCSCSDHGDCVCGCEDDTTMEVEVESVPTSKMAEKMKTASKKKTISKRK